MRSDSAWVISLLSSSSFSVMMFCFSSVPENLVLFLVAYQLFLRGFDFHLQVDQLFRKPVGRLHGGFELGLEVLLHVSRCQRIHDAGGQLRIGAGVMNLHDPGVRNQTDVETAFKAREQRRDVAGIALQRVGDKVRLLWIGMAAEFGALIKIQLADHLQRHQIALQDANFGIQFGLIVIIHHRLGIFEGYEIRIAPVDHDLPDAS